MNPVRIGTRESALALWQTNQVQQLLETQGLSVEIVPIKSEGDIDLQTPLYEMGVQGIFTKSLDVALLNNRIDLAVHSMKDVPVMLPQGLMQAAVLKRGNHTDLLVYKNEWNDTTQREAAIIATSSIRRKAQWLHRYPQDELVNLRGNVNTRLQKLVDNNWNGAIFAAAGLERLGQRPENSIELDWMLPAPAQGAIMVVCRQTDIAIAKACSVFNDKNTAVCTAVERGFLRRLMGGCSVPISAFAETDGKEIHFKGNIFSVDGKHNAVVEKTVPFAELDSLGTFAADELLNHGGRAIADTFRNE